MQSLYIYYKFALVSVSVGMFVRIIYCKGKIFFTYKRYFV